MTSFSSFSRVAAGAAWAAAALLGSSTALAQADAYPSKVITLVVTYPSGGGPT